VSAKIATAALAAMLPMALAAMKAGGCSNAKMM
jgi:hypothetical protein